MELAPIVESREDALEWLRRRVHPIVQKIFHAEVPGRSFADIGCMWNCHGAYTFFAESIGARDPILAVDLGPPTPSFRSLHDALGSRIEFRQGDILEIQPKPKEGYDVVFCSGVLYHAPDPMRLLAAVSALAADTLILTTHTIEGDDSIMRFYPYDPRPETYPWEALAGGREVRFQVRYPDAGPWWFAPTEPCVAAMLRTLGLRVVDVQREVLAQRAGDPLNPQISFITARREAV
jgi:hypothetical protein